MQLVRVSNAARKLYFPALLGSLILANVIAGFASRSVGSPRETAEFRQAEAMAHRLKSILRNDNSTLLIIDGASRSQYGIEFEVLEKRIDHVSDVDILPLTFRGADHFYRNALHEHLLSSLDDEGQRLLRAKRVIMLREFQRSYDTRPLTWFYTLHQSYTNEALAYLTPATAVDALRATYMSRGLDEENQRIVDFATDLAAHAFINGFNIGLVHTFARSEGRAVPREPRFHLEVKPAFEFPGLGDAREAAERFEPTAGWRKPSWIQLIREPRFQHLWGEYVDTEVYFAMPSVYRWDVNYTSNFCVSTKGIACILPWRDHVMFELDAVQYWRDGGHLLASGVPIATSWLAARVIALQAIER